MQRQAILAQTAQQEIRPVLFYRWMRYFFAEDRSSQNQALLDMQRRATWIGLAFILQALNEIDHGIYFPLLGPVASLVPLALIASSFYAMWMAFRPDGSSQQSSTELPKHPAQAERRYPPLWQRAVLILTLLLTIPGAIVFGRTIALSFFLPPQFSNDGTSLDTNAAILLLEGRNPYSDSNMLDIARKFPIQPNWTTPLRQGQFANRLDYPTMAEFQSVLDTAMKSGDAPEFESKVSYPALSFLTLVPFAIFGSYNVLFFYFLSYLLIVGIAWKIVRPQLRPWVLLFAMANIPMWSSTVGGNLDIFYTLLIVVAWVMRERRWSSSVFLGLAIASKQIAWFFTPFYLIMVWRQHGFKEAINRAVIAGGLGLLINLPFLLWDPRAFIAGVMAPLVDPMFPMGVGIINLSVTHLIPYLPSAVYTVLEALAMLVCLVWYWRICLRRPEAAMLLAIIPLFFAWRSLPSYFYCAAFPLFICLSEHTTPSSLGELLSFSGLSRFVRTWSPVRWQASA